MQTKFLLLKLAGIHILYGKVQTMARRVLLMKMKII